MVVIDDRLPEQVSTEGLCGSTTSEMREWKPGFKANSQLTIFDIPMRPVREDQRHRRRFTR